MQKSPYANTHPARELADNPHVVRPHPGNYFGPVQVIPVQAGNKLKGAKEKYTGIYVNTHTHTPKSNQWGQRG